LKKSSCRGAIEKKRLKITALNVRSIKNSKSLLECPAVTALVAAFDAKAFSNTELLKSYLVGGNRIINFYKPTENIPVKCLTKHMAYVLYKFHVCFFLSVPPKNKHTRHMRGAVAV